MSVSGSIIARIYFFGPEVRIALHSAPMKRFHLIFGLVMLVVFLLTGQYMDRVHEHLRNMADGPRMLYRRGTSSFCFQVCCTWASARTFVIALMPPDGCYRLLALRW